MKLKKIEINNFRLLKEFNIDLEDNLSLVIGKNNCGKTSLIICIQKFISNKNEFVYDDFNLEFKNELYSINTNFKHEEKYENVGIKMKLFIEYSREDNLSKVSSLIMDLNPDNLFTKPNGKESIVKRTEKIFYVCCTRAKKRLVVYYCNPSKLVIDKAKEIFEEENVKNIDT